MLKFRASSLADIMSDPKSIDPALLTPELLAISESKKKTDADRAILAPYFDATLSAGAITVIDKLAKQSVYGYDETISSKYMDKGIQCENDSLALINAVFFADYQKNTERKTNEWISGECDIYTPEKIIDIKTSWSLVTFPSVGADGESSRYEWQGRAYMWLWDVEQFEINYCLVTTPEDLIGYEPAELHYVDHIAPELRVTRICYTRDRLLEQKIKTKVESARRYYDQRIRQIVGAHTF